MQVSKWGNSLAVRLPTAVVDELDLKEGDQIEIRIARERVFEVSRDQSKPHALARLRKLRRPLPPGFVFDREEANARSGLDLHDGQTIDGRLTIRNPFVGSSGVGRPTPDTAGLFPNCNRTN